jgi:hypothetical protein
MWRRDVSVSACLFPFQRQLVQLRPKPVIHFTGSAHPRMRVSLVGPGLALPLITIPCRSTVSESRSGTRGSSPPTARATRAEFPVTGKQRPWRLTLIRQISQAWRLGFGASLRCLVRLAHRPPLRRLSPTDSGSVSEKGVIRPSGAPLLKKWQDFFRVRRNPEVISRGRRDAPGATPVRLPPIVAMIR